jgi:hypothetical protein
MWLRLSPAGGSSFLADIFSLLIILLWSLLNPGEVAEFSNIRG